MDNPINGAGAPKKTLPKAAIAAVIVLVVAAGVWAYLSMGKPSPTATNSVAQNSGPAASSKIIAYVGFSTLQPYWVSLASYIKTEMASRSLKYIDLTPGSLDPQVQKNALHAAVNPSVGGIILGGGGDPTVLKSDLDQALKLNIPVIAVDTNIDHPAVKGFIATDNLAGAKIAGDYIVSATHGKGTVLILGGTVNHPNGDARKNGVTEEVQKAGMKMIFHYADWVDDEAYKYTDQELAKKNDISAIFVAWDPGAIAAAQVVEKRGLKGKIVIVGFDGLQKNLEEIEAGNISATIAQPIKQIGREGVQMIVDVMAGKPIPAVKLAPGILVTKDNVEQYLQ
jgi:ribose transport system substrate-binding protein